MRFLSAPTPATPYLEALRAAALDNPTAAYVLAVLALAAVAHFLARSL